MKRQYFGDARDLVKYKLLEALVRMEAPPRRLTCLWMLTPDDTSGEGMTEFIDDPDLAELCALLRTSRNGERGPHLLRAYYESHGVDYLAWHDDRYFHDDRIAYFTSVPADALRNAVVFFDPDKGLTDRARPTLNHLTFAEVGSVLARMDASSVAVIYQHYWHRADFAEWMAGELRTRFDRPVGWVDDRTAKGRVVFYVLPGLSVHRSAVDAALAHVAGPANRHHAPVR